MDETSKRNASAPLPFKFEDGDITIRSNDNFNFMSSNHAIVQPLSEDLLSCVKEMITHLSKNKDKNRTLHKQSLSTATPPPTTSTAYAFDSGLAKSIFGKNIKENDLTVVEGIGPKFRSFFIKIILKLGNLYQTVVFKNVNLYLTMQAKPTEFTILEHGQSKQEWPMKGNGKNY
ncbi:MAG: hypothetical protein ACPGJN_04200 [Flavobacteriaceae bacterium]